MKEVEQTWLAMEVVAQARVPVDSAGGPGEPRDVGKGVDTRAVWRQIWQDLVAGCTQGCLRIVASNL